MLGHDIYFETRRAGLHDELDPYMAELTTMMLEFLYERLYFESPNFKDSHSGKLYTISPVGIAIHDDENHHAADIRFDYKLDGENNKVGFVSLYIDVGEQSVSLSILGDPGNATIAIDFSCPRCCGKLTQPSLMIALNGAIKGSLIGQMRTHICAYENAPTEALVDIARSITALHKIPQRTA